MVGGRLMARRSTPTLRLRPQPGDPKVRYCENLTCPDGHDFGLDRDRFYAAHTPRRDTVACPFCRTPTPIPTTRKAPRP